MNFHNITHDDMNNGDGLRVVLWVAGCEHHCKNCQNPITWDFTDGVEFDKSYKKYCAEYMEIRNQQTFTQDVKDWAMSKVQRDYEQGFQGIEMKLNTVGSSNAPSSSRSSSMAAIACPNR